MTTAVPPSHTSPEYKIVIESATISSVPAAGLSGLCLRWAEGNPTVLSGSPARPEGMSDWPFAGSAPACSAFRATRPATSLRNSALKSGGTSEAVCVAVARGSALPTNRPASARATPVSSQNGSTSRLSRQTCQRVRRPHADLMKRCSSAPLPAMSATSAARSPTSCSQTITFGGTFIRFSFFSRSAVQVWTVLHG